MLIEQYLIRKALVNDVDNVGKLYDDVNDSYSAPGWKKGEYPSLTTVRNAVDKDSLYIFISDDEILGACIIDHDQHPAYAQLPWSIKAVAEQVIVIHSLVSHPKHRGKGIGKKLIDYSVDYARKCNATTIRLDTHITNIPARALYEKCGFHEIIQWTGIILDIQQTFSVFEYLL